MPNERMLSQFPERGSLTPYRASCGGVADPAKVLEVTCRSLFQRYRKTITGDAALAPPEKEYDQE